MNLYFDISGFVNKTLPTFLRKPIIKGYLKVLNNAVVDLFSATNVLYTSIISELLVSPQTDVLQAKLRVLYPNVGSFKVYVKTKHDVQPIKYIQRLGGHMKQVHAYKLSESVGNGFVYTLDEMNLPINYQIIIPTAYTSSLAAINYLANKYRPAGKQFEIIFQNVI